MTKQTHYITILLNGLHIINSLFLIKDKLQGAELLLTNHIFIKGSMRFTSIAWFKNFDTCNKNIDIQVLYSQNRQRLRFSIPKKSAYEFK